MGTNHVTTPVYHPQVNGLCERFNRTLADMLSMYILSHHHDWDEFVPFVLFAYNSSQQETTGFIPSFLLHGHESVVPIDVNLQNRSSPPKGNAACITLPGVSRALQWER